LAITRFKLTVEKNIMEIEKIKKFAKIQDLVDVGDFWL
jgi:hypothetical protein